MSGHAKGVLEANFQLLQSTQVLPRHLPGSENASDALTKTLPRATLRYLLRRYFGLEVNGVDKKAAQKGFSLMRKIGLARVKVGNVMIARDGMKIRDQLEEDFNGEC